MKKIVILSSLLFSMAAANAETVRIYNNSDHTMFVNYQVCFRDFKNGKSAADCLPPVYNIQINEGVRFSEIVLPEYLDYAKVISAYEITQDGAILARGEFPGEEDCKSFNRSPATLSVPADSREVRCERTR